MSGTSSNATAAQRRAAKQHKHDPAAKAAKPDAKQPVEETPEQKEEREYQEQLKADADEAAAELERKRVAAMNGAGAALRESTEKKEAAAKAAIVSAEAAKAAAAKVTTDAKTLGDDVKNLAEGADKLANEAARVSADAAEVAKEAEKVAEIATSHVDACDLTIFGSFDPTSRYCQNCLTAFKECAAACQALTAYKEAQGVKPAKVSGGTERAPRVRNGVTSKFNKAVEGTKSYIMDVSLETPRTLAEHAAHCGFEVSRIKAHIKWLLSMRSSQCKQVIGEGGKIHFEVI